MPKARVLVVDDSVTARNHLVETLSADPDLEVAGEAGDGKRAIELCRTLRPDVVLAMNIQGSGGDRAHEASAVLTREAFRAAGDPAMFPEQIREGIRRLRQAVGSVAQSGQRGKLIGAR